MYSLESQQKQINGVNKFKHIFSSGYSQSTAQSLDSMQHVSLMHCKVSDAKSQCAAMNSINITSAPVKG